MNREQTDTCASCKEFPIEEALENPQAHCGWWEQYPRCWNDRACVLYVRADNINERRQVVKQLVAQQENKGNN